VGKSIHDALIVTAYVDYVLNGATKHPLVANDYWLVVRLKGSHRSRGHNAVFGGSLRCPVDTSPADNSRALSSPHEPLAPMKPLWDTVSIVTYQ